MNDRAEYAALIFAVIIQALVIAAILAACTAYIYFRAEAEREAHQGVVTSTFPMTGPE
jgi:hypothetical protein